MTDSQRVMWNYFCQQWDYFTLALIVTLYVILGALAALDLFFIAVG